MAELMQQMAARIQDLERRLADTQSAAAAATPVPSGTPEARAPNSVGHGFGTVDTRVLGKPETFDGTQSKWKDWSTVARAYFMLVSPDLQRLMADAEASADPVLNALALDQSEVKASTTLYYVLLMLCRGPAMDRVVNSGVGEGLEAWRQLVLRHEPRQRSRYAGQMMELLSWSFAGDVVARLEAFEREVTQWKAASKEVMSDSILIGVVLRNLEEGGLKQHLIMNADKLKT